MVTYLQLTDEQIPTMVVEGEPAPVPDSLNISYWFCSVYPRLLPQTQEAKIKNYLSQLHSIEAISLSAARPEQPQEDNLPTACDEMLANTGISDEYRLALEHKKEV